MNKLPRERKQVILEKLAARSSALFELSEEALKTVAKTHPSQAKALQSIRKSKPAGDAARKLPKGSDEQVAAIDKARGAMGGNRAVARGLETPPRSPRMETLVQGNKKRRVTAANNWGLTAKPGRQAEQATWNTRRGGNVGTPGRAGGQGRAKK
tara:strand:- start:1276 stop:1737 length:462 start_codon:yes stop_codon:yes gene_type:complete